MDKEEFKIRLLYTEYRGHESELTKIAISEKADIVAVCGGTGSAFFSIQNLVFTKIQLVFIPTAAGNIFSYLFGIRSIKKGIETIKNGVVRNMDIGQFDNDDVGRHYFMCFAGTGISPYSAKEALKKTKRIFLDYVFSLYKVLSRYKPYAIKVQFQETKETFYPFEIFVGNIQTYGKTFSFIPYTSIFDGLFDVLVIPKMTLSKIISFSIKSLIGLAYELKDFSKYYKVDKIKLFFDSKQMIQLDYEPFDVEGECIIQVLPLALPILVPKNRVNI